MDCTTISGQQLKKYKRKNEVSDPLGQFELYLYVGWYYSTLSYVFSPLLQNLLFMLDLLGRYGTR